MPFIDDRGRLFGKVNLIDAAVGIFLLVLIPLGYSAYLLFRDPVPTIVSVEPAQIVEYQPATIRIQGQDLRPYLRARLGDTEFSFLVESTSAGMVRLTEEEVAASRNILPVGTYDLVLLDEARELVRKPGALSVIPAPSPPPPPPPPEVAVQVAGTFIGLSKDEVDRIKVGAKLGPFAEVLALRPPEPGTQRIIVPAHNAATHFVDSPMSDTVQVPALIRIHCERTPMPEPWTQSVECHVGDAMVVRNDVTPIPTEDGTFDFIVTEVRPADAEIVFEPPSPEVEVSVQVVGAFIGLSNEDVDRIKVGSRMGPLAEVLAARPPERGTQRILVLGRTTTGFVDTPFEDTVQVPAILRLSCEQLLRDQCSIGDVPLVRDAVIPIPTDNGGTSNFVVTEVRPADALPVFQTGFQVVVQAFGTFTGLSVDEAAFISVGSMFGPFAEVMAVGSPEPATDRLTVGGGTVASTPVGNKVQLPALLRLTCQRSLPVSATRDGQCTVGAVALVQDAVVELPVSGGYFASSSSQSEGRRLSFQVRELQPADARIESTPLTRAVATVRVRFIVRPEAVDLLNVGAVDVGTPLDARRATVTAIDSDQRQVTALGDFASIPGQRYQFEQPMVVFTGTVRIPVVRAQSGWEYKATPVKVGASFVFETVESLTEGAIIAMTIESSPEPLAR